jgi:hypothetical protein
LSSDKPARLSAQSTRSAVSEVSGDAVYEHGECAKAAIEKTKKKNCNAIFQFG